MINPLIFYSTDCQKWGKKIKWNKAHHISQEAPSNSFFALTIRNPRIFTYCHNKQKKQQNPTCVVARL